MTPARNHDNPAQPALDVLFSQYLERQAHASGEGLGHAEISGEIAPYEAIPVQPIEPRLAWEDGLTALRCFQPSFQSGSVQPSTDWPTVVAQHEPAMSLAFAVGNFPQLVRNLHPLWHTEKLTTLRPRGTKISPMASLADWASQTARSGHFPQVLVAIGSLRLAKHFDLADKLLVRHRAEVPAGWQAGWANEEAALAWHQGQAEEAQRLWLFQADSTPVLFNRGMAALFLGKSADARTSLSQVVKVLPPSSSWYHLAHLYLALADLRA